MSNSYSIGRLFDIPIRLHITLLIFLPLFALSFAPMRGLAGLLLGAVGAIGLFASVALHEVGHSLVARAKGAAILEILLLPIGGMARLDRMPGRPADEIQIAAAGPAVSFALAATGFLIAPFLYLFHPFLWALSRELARINLMLAVFNLIPSFPMDGGRIFRAILTPRLGRLGATRIAAAAGRGFAWVFGLLAVLPVFYGGTVIFTLLLIAFFVHQAATAEYRQVQMEAAYHARQAQAGRLWQIPDTDITVGPPPYARPRPDPRRASRGLFDDLFNHWGR